MTRAAHTVDHYTSGILGVRARFRRDLSRDAMLMIGLLIGVAIAAGQFAEPVDARNYFDAGSSLDLYPTSWTETRDGLLFYPPPFVQLMRLLQPVGWQLFIVGLMTATFGAFWYCARSWSLPIVALGAASYALGSPVLLVLPQELFGAAILGNVQWLLAAVSLVVIRRPVLWSVLALSKMTTAVGWWWHPLRGEWRAASIGAVTTAMLVGISVVLDPRLWADFAGFVARNYAMENSPMTPFPIPLGVRIVTGLALVVWGARTNRAWTVPVATGWAIPALWGLGFLPFWLAPIREGVTAAVAVRRYPSSPEVVRP